MVDHKIECKIEDGDMQCEWDGRKVKTNKVMIPVGSKIELTAESKKGWNCEGTPPNYDNTVFCHAMERGSGFGSAEMELHEPYKKRRRIVGSR